MPRKWTLEGLAGELRDGKSSSRKLVEQALANISDAAGEGPRAFIKVDVEGALAAADYQDRLRRQNRQPSPFAGIPISVKDLFDLAGEVTTAGSKVLKDAAPALADAPAIAALKSAGLVVLGRTNMTEFAYSGVGLNPHYGTPRSAFDRKHRAHTRRLIVGGCGCHCGRDVCTEHRYGYGRLLPYSCGL